MAIPKQPVSPPPHHGQLVLTPNATKKSGGGGGGKDVKQRANLYVSKLADRDTEAMAVTELESMARALPAESLPSFLSAISDTRPSDKTPLRRHCLRLLSVLSRAQPPQSLSPFLPRMVSSVLRRLRDPDSSVRSACVDAVRDMSCCSSGGSASASFCSVFFKPLSESLLLEQDHNAQMGSAMCLAAAIEEAAAAGGGVAGALDHDLAQQLHRLVPRMVKLARSEGFKAKPALLSLLGSIVAVGGASTQGLVDILVPCLADALSADDWAARKAASEGLTHVAAIRDCHLLSAFKSSYFSSFQARRFDKVKIVRESMTLMLEAWKDVPDALGEEDDRGTNSSPSQSRSSSARRERESDGRLVGSRTSGSARSSSPQTLKKDRSPISRSPPTDASSTPSARRSTPPRNEKRTSPPLFRNVDRSKIPDWKIEIAIPRSPPFAVMRQDEHQNDCDRVADVWDQGGNQENASSKLEVKRLLFEKNSEQRVNKFGCLKAGSRVVPYQEKGSFEETAEKDELFEDNKDNDLSLIRKQLLQIENQQSSLVDLVERFIGNSQTGIRSLETRVHGIEMALDEISYDLAMSSGRMPSSDPTIHCCKIPGAEFLSSKFWRRNEGRYSSRFSISGTSQLAGTRNSLDKGTVDSLNWEKQGFRHNSGFLINPLAEVNPQSRGSSLVCSDRMRKSTMHESAGRQVEDGHMISETSSNCQYN